MAHCPNCGKKLHIYDWKPDCPHCGVNMVYFKSNERLLAESEATEIAHAKSQPSIDRAKAGTIGTTIGKIRMAFFLLPIALLFLPIYSITVGGSKVNYNAITAVNFITSLDTGKITSLISPLLLSIVFLAIPAVCCIVFTFMQMAAVKKKGLKRNIVLSSVSLALVIASAACFGVFARNPVKTYGDLVQAEAAYAVGSGDQEAVDTAVQKLRNLTGDKTVDISLLNRAIAEGEMNLALSRNYGYTAEEKQALTDALKAGKTLLIDGKADDIHAVRDAAGAIRAAACTYSGLESALHNANEEVIASEDGAFTDKTLAELNSGILATRKVMQYAVKNAQLITNDNGLYSEGSFNGLQGAIENAQAHLDALDKGELIVDNSGEIPKTEKQIAKETADTLQNDFNNLNGSLCGLTDVSVANALLQKTESAEADGSLQAAAGENIKAAPHIGIFALILFYIAQLVFNIFVCKKGIQVKYTPCLIGGLPSEEYFAMVNAGESDLEIRKKMVAALQKMQDEVRAAAAKAEEEALAERANRK